MDKMFLSYLPYYFFIQGSSHFPYIRVVVHVFTSQGLVLFNLLIFLVHFLVLLVCIFLILNLALWLLQDLLGQDLRLTYFKLIFQYLLMGSYQLLIPDIQPNIVLSEPLSADNHFVLSKVEDQEGLVQESSSSHNQMEYDGMCDLWSI